MRNRLRSVRLSVRVVSYNKPIVIGVDHHREPKGKGSWLFYNYSRASLCACVCVCVCVYNPLSFDGVIHVCVYSFLFLCFDIVTGARRISCVSIALSVCLCVRYFIIIISSFARLYTLFFSLSHLYTSRLWRTNTFRSALSSFFSSCPCF